MKTINLKQPLRLIASLVFIGLIVYSFGKTFHSTGWKLGYCVAPEPLMLEFRKVHQFNVFSCNSL